MGPTYPLTGHHHYKSTSLDTLWGLLTYSRDTITINSHPWILYGVYLPTHGTPPLQINIHGYSMGPTYPLTGHHHYKFTSMDSLWGLLTNSRDTITINSHPWILYGVYSRDTITINSHPWILYGAYSPTHGTPPLQIHIHGYSMGSTHGTPPLQIHIHGYFMGSTHLLTGHHHYKFTSMATLWGLLTHSRDTITINSHPWLLYGAYLPTHGTPSL